MRILGHTDVYDTEITGSNNAGTEHVHLSGLRSIDRGPQPSGPYTAFDKDDGSRSMSSQKDILNSKTV